MRTLSSLLAVLALVSATSQALARDLLLSDGIRSVQLGDSESTALEKFRSVWPGIEWDCSVKSELPGVKTCMMINIGRDSDKNALYGGFFTFMAGLQFKSGTLQSIELFFGRRNAQAAFAGLSSSLPRVVFVPSREFDDEVSRRKVWNAKDSELVLAYEKAEGQTRLSYGSRDFALWSFEARRKSNQKSFGL